MTVTDTTPSLMEAMLLQYRVEQFYFREVELLDSWLWPEWFDLFTDDCRYWMPLRKNRLRRQRGADQSPRGIHMAHFDDDKRTLGLRVAQKETGTHWAEDPPSRSRHLITNVRVAPSETGDNELEVKSNFFCYRNRLETEVDLWAGERQDVLRPTGDSFMIAHRTVLLDQNVVLSKNLSVFF